MANSSALPDINSWQFCFLPSSLIEYPPISHSCPSSYSLLISLLIYNAFSAALNLCLGHDTTRHFIQDSIPDRLFFLTSSSEHWQPYAAIFMAIIQIVGMVVATAIAPSSGFNASFGSLLGLWSMRPRMAILTFLYDAWGHGPCFREVYSRPFRYTLRDTILSECLLNIFSIFFALNLLQHAGQDDIGCQVNYEAESPSWLWAFQSALGWKIVGGCLSAFVLAGQFLECLRTRVYEDDEGKLDNLVFFASLFIALVNFITSWEIWGVFVNAAGSSYCPGSVVGTGVTWGVVVINSCMRPLLGGGSIL